MIEYRSAFKFHFLYSFKQIMINSSLFHTYLSNNQLKNTYAHWVIIIWPKDYIDKHRDAQINTLVIFSPVTSSEKLYKWYAFVTFHLLSEDQKKYFILPLLVGIFVRRDADSHAIFQIFITFLAALSKASPNQIFLKW